ncbi:MAG: cytochrome c3 family protein [Candidatus Nitrohelix vancouverensis]|uniref:Cytochrome c3 family protein n=1 Tax=Candidatus Nitrohelix vancouverensis TaxID=2705534 RepID=A0A7T0C066_9BACT|nr:MAG: cytochrome c3 family protein [Candidatus Nitrohelix vancouverensis]
MSFFKSIALLLFGLALAGAGFEGIDPALSGAFQKPVWDWSQNEYRAPDGVDPDRDNSLQSPQWNPQAQEGPTFSEKEIITPTEPLEKRMAQPLSDLLDLPYLSADDLPDPFPFLRGPGGAYKSVMKPGVTLGGVRFDSYGQTDKFIENFYRQSGFPIDKVFKDVAYNDQSSRCLHCHQGIEEIDHNHRFRCTQCHNGQSRKKSLPDAHKNLVKNPSAPEHVEKFCGKCHAKQIEQMNASTKNTLAGINDSVHFAWGTPPTPAVKTTLPADPAKAGETTPQAPLAKAPHYQTGENPAAEQFLKNQCRQCHIGSEAPKRAGDYRATGCAACHMIYTNDGVSLSHDKAIQYTQREDIQNRSKRFLKKYQQDNPDKRGYPVMHKFTSVIPSVQCEHCHHNNGVGSEYEGLFALKPLAGQEADPADREQPALHGVEHQFLLPDIHREKGMHCIDCHAGKELKPEPGQEKRAGVQCQDCHGGLGKRPESFLLTSSDARSKEILQSTAKIPALARSVKEGDSILVTASGIALPHIQKIKNDWILVSKVTGKKHRIPQLPGEREPVAHRIAKHMNTMECHTCHARWSASEWGMLVKKPATATTPNDAASWSQSFVDLSWDTLILGKNQRGRYSLMKPQFQYFFPDPLRPQSAAVPATTHRGTPGMLVKAYAPHTTRKIARRCESCHQNQMAVGLGSPFMETVDSKDLAQTRSGETSTSIPLKQMTLPNGSPLQTVYPADGSRFLNKQEQEALLKTSDAYRAYRFLNLKEMQFPRLLRRNDFPYDARRKALTDKFEPVDLDEELLAAPELEDEERDEPLPTLPTPLEDDGERPQTNNNLSQPFWENDQPVLP